MKIETHDMSIEQESFITSWWERHQRSSIATPSKLTLTIKGVFGGHAGELVANIKDMGFVFVMGKPTPSKNAIRSYLVMLRSGGWMPLESSERDQSIKVMILNIDDVELLTAFLLEQRVKSFRIETGQEVSMDQLWRRWATIYFDEDTND